MALLNDEYNGIRVAAINALSVLIPDEVNVRAAITEMLNDEHYWIRVTAINALSVLIPDEANACAAIAEMLNDEHYETRVAAVNALSVVVSVDSNVCDLVMSLLLDNDSQVREAAINASTTVVTTQLNIRSAITEILRDGGESNHVKEAAINVLTPLVATEPDVRETVADFLTYYPSYEVREAAFNALHTAVATNPDISIDIADLLYDGSWRLRKIATKALAQRLPSEKDILEVVIAYLHDSDWRVRRAGVNTLAELVDVNPIIRDLIVELLNDEDWHVKEAAVYALEPLVATDADIRTAICDVVCKSELDEFDKEAWAAFNVLAKTITTCPDISSTFIPLLHHNDWYVKVAAIRALAPIVDSDSNVRMVITTVANDGDKPRIRETALKVLLSCSSGLDAINQAIMWLGADYVEDEDDREPEPDEKLRIWLSEWLVPIIGEDLQLRSRMVSLLDSPSRFVRIGAVRTLASLPNGPPTEVIPKILGTLTDASGEESWPNRLASAQIFINSRAQELSQQSINVCIEALDYATQPWYHQPESGPEVRKQAALILGQIDPLYRDPAIFARLTRLMQEDKDAQVRDAAYSALMRLAAAPEEKRG
ncbi:MAG: HEAT repeat domain-containing protein [Chloroflexota bacterium]